MSYLDQTRVCAQNLGHICILAPVDASGRQWTPWQLHRNGTSGWRTRTSTLTSRGTRRAATWPCQRWRATCATPSSSLRSGGRTSATSWTTMWSRSRRETRADVEKISQDVFPSLTLCTVFSSSHDYPVAADDCPTRLEITIVSVTFSIDHCKTIMSEMRSWFFWLIDGQRQQGLFKTVKLRNMFSWFVI